MLKKCSFVSVLFRFDTFSYVKHQPATSRSALALSRNKAPGILIIPLCLFANLCLAALSVSSGWQRGGLATDFDPASAKVRVQMTHRAHFRVCNGKETSQALMLLIAIRHASSHAHVNSADEDKRSWNGCFKGLKTLQWLKRARAEPKSWQNTLIIITQLGMGPTFVFLDAWLWILYRCCPRRESWHKSFAHTQREMLIIELGIET